MTRLMPAAALAALVLSACAPAPGPATPPDFTIGAEDYVILRDGETWRVGQPGDTVLCRRPTVEDCYWSLRAKLQAEAALDEIP